MPSGSVETVPVLSEWVQTVTFERLPAWVTEQAKLLVLDTIACGVAALGEPEPVDVVNAVDRLGGAPQASIIGWPGKTSVTNTVLANGVLVRFLDLNDFLVGTLGTGTSTSGHPSDNIPVALTMGDWKERSGEDVIAAIVMGYELFGRLSGLMEKTSAWDGTSVSGVVAPAMAGRLMGLDQKKLAHAIALGAARCATPAIMRAGNISAGKFLANALVAQSGVQGALLAEHGMTGPLAVLDHERGLQQVFPPPIDTARLTAPIADDSTIMKSCVKTYPCLATGQVVVSTALEARKALRGRTEEIDRIVIKMIDNDMIRRQQADPGRLDPQSREAADHSFPFLAAVSLLDGELTPRQFDNQRWLDPATRALMSRITLATDPSFNSRGANRFPCAFEMTLHGGATRRVEVERLPGHATDGLDRENVVRKFETVTQGLLSDDNRDAVRDLVLKLETLASVSPIMERLANGSRLA